MTINKFKVGDKVRILPSAVSGGVSEEDVNKIGEIIGFREEHGYFLVAMDNRKRRNSYWAVYPNQIEHTVVKGQQLLFDFMNE